MMDAAIARLRFINEGIPGLDPQDRMLRKPEDDELVARMDFARNALTQQRTQPE